MSEAPDQRFGAAGRRATAGQSRSPFGTNHVLKGIDLTVHKGEHVVIFGPSGSGKSTLLRTINLLETPRLGLGVVRGQGVRPPASTGESLPKGKARLLRQQIGMVFQQFNLFPHVTALDNVALALRRVKRMARPEAEMRARHVSRQGWGCWTSWAPTPASCRAASSNGWRSPAPW